MSRGSNTKSNTTVANTEVGDDLDKQGGNTDESVTVRIPVDPLNPTDLDVVVSINCETTIIKRGIDVNVKRSVYEILRQAQYI